MMNREYRKIGLALIVATGIALSACGGAAPAPAPTAPPATAMPAPAEPTALPDPTATAAAAAESPTEAPPAEAPAAAAAVTYKIVPEESKASYTVDETFINQNNKLATAIGVTTLVNGEITLDAAAPANSKVGEITVDISAFKSDSDRRDGAIRERWLESAKFPIVKFVPTAYEGLPASYEAGADITFRVTGDMTVRDTTKPVTFDVTARLDGGTLAGTAVTEILMSDFNFEAPNIAGILRAEDKAKLTLEFVAKP